MRARKFRIEFHGLFRILQGVVPSFQVDRDEEQVVKARAGE